MECLALNIFDKQKCLSVGFMGLSGFAAFYMNNPAMRQFIK